MTVAKYLRLSDADGDLKRAGKDESNSIANQRNLLDSFIQQKEDFAGATVLEFCDDGWSGKNFQRPAVTEMLAQVKAGQIQCIIVKDLSRFGRDYLTVGNYISSVFPFLGVRFIAINDGLDSIRPYDVDSLDTSFKALLYDLYSRDLSRKVKSAKRARAQRGDFVAPFAPYGYRKNPENHNQLVIDPPAAEVVRRIFHLAADGDRAVEIARRLNAGNVPTPMLYKRVAGCSRTRWPSVSEDNFWTDHAVTKILRDKRYLGANIYGKRARDIVGGTHSVKVDREDWVTVENAHEPIVAQEEFDRAQAALREFKEHDGYTEKQPLARKICCGVCGHTLTRSYGKEKFYYCRTHQLVNGAACIEVHTPEKDLLAAILDSLRAQAALAVDREKLLAEQRKIAQRETRAVQRELEVLRETQERLNREIRKLYEAFALGNISKPDYLAQKKALTKQRDEAAKKFDQIQSKADSHPVKENPLERFKALAQAEKVTEDIAKDLLKEVRVFPHGRLEIVWNCRDEL